MFEVKPYKVIVKDLHKIADNFFSILNDGDNDILYSGTNAWGNRILGSIVFEDDEVGYLRYFHTLVTDKDFYSFINGETSLKSILENSESFYVIDKHYNGEIFNYNLVPIEDIPVEFLPLDNSFCPAFAIKPSLDYVFSLKGSLADIHRAEPEVMNEMNSKFQSFLKTSSRFLNTLEIYPHIYSEPAKTGSFELSYRIEFNESETLFSQPNNDIVAFLLKLYSYIFNQLPKEQTGLLKQEKIESLLFNEMKNDFVEIFRKRGRIEQSDKDQEVIDLISYSVENFREVNYIGFDRIEVINRTEEGNNNPIALIDKEFYRSIENKINKPEAVDKPDIIIVDEKPFDYEVQVYSLNKESGNGKVYVKLKNGIVRIPIYLKGKANYQNTKFTKNMDEIEPTMMNIQAIGTRKNGELQYLVYYFN